MSCALGENVWVFHSGALGDHVMIWPLVRAMARQGARVTVVGVSSHVALCEREVGGSIGAGDGRVVGRSVERPRFSRMWSGSVVEGDVERGATTVLSMVADDSSEAGVAWMGAAREVFLGAAVECVGPPGSISRREVWERARVAEFGLVRAAAHADGSIVLFVGAGGEGKRWAMERWVELAGRLRDVGHVALLAGPVEAERFGSAERAMFDRAGGRIVGGDGELGTLVEEIRGARLFVGCDTGPTHLAAQMGVATIALFGPTDAAVWEPVGPSVCLIAPERVCGMEWIGVDRVRVEVARCTLER